MSHCPHTVGRVMREKREGGREGGRRKESGRKRREEREMRRREWECKYLYMDVERQTVNS